MKKCDVLYLLSGHITRLSTGSSRNDICKFNVELKSRFGGDFAVTRRQQRGRLWTSRAVGIDRRNFCRIRNDYRVARSSHDVVINLVVARIRGWAGIGAIDHATIIAHLLACYASRERDSSATVGDRRRRCHYPYRSRLEIIPVRWLCK